MCFSRVGGECMGKIVLKTQHDEQTLFKDEGNWIPFFKILSLCYKIHVQKKCTVRMESYCFMGTELQFRMINFWSVAMRSYSSPKVTGESARLRQRRSGAEELPHARGQGRRPRGATPHPRSRCCAGTEGLSGAAPRSRSGGAALRRYASSKVRSSGCALLEESWRNTPHPR